MTALFEIVLVISTLPIWTGTPDFAAVPLLGQLKSVPFIIDQCLTVTMLLACAALLFAPLRTRYSLALCIASLSAGGCLALLNQHRLQPWHWLFLLIAAQQLVTPPDRGRLNRLTLASIYIFAAVSRFGPHVADGMSLQVLIAALKLGSGEHLLNDPQLVLVACVAMNVAELLIGIMLLLPRTRKVAIIAAVLLHVSLLLLLGPLGLDHQSGVLLWNTYLLIAIPMVFRSQRPGKDASQNSGDQQSPDEPELNKTAIVFALFVIGFPLAGLFGLSDNWLSWQVYSPRPEVVKLLVSSEAVDQLPAPVKSHIGDPVPLQTWRPVRVNQWSLACTRSPLYPEDRFQLGIVRDLVAGLKEGEWTVEIDGPQTWRWWRRRSTTIESVEDLNAASSRFLFNSTVSRRP